MKALKVLERVFDDSCYITDEEISEAIKELEQLDNDLKDLFSCIELTEDETAEKRLSSMETYLKRLSKFIK